MKKIDKEYLNTLVKKYETTDFILDDPIQFPHRYSSQVDIEISGLIASSLAYGKRERIIEAVEIIHNIMNNKPHQFCLNYNYQKDKALFDDFSYRYTKGKDIALLLNSLSMAIKKYETIETAFMQGYCAQDKNIKQSLERFVDKLISFAPNNEGLKGLNYLIPNPRKGSACKRLNLYLKWMIRKGPVDLGIWQNIPTNKLLIPLDVHVSRISRELGFTNRKSNDWSTTEEITDKLKQFDPNDPAKYDFAIFGASVSGDKIKLE